MNPNGPKITAGMTWHVPIQISANPQQIAASTAASPSSLYVPQHGYTTGDKVVISGCSLNVAINNTESNPKWTIVVTNADNFTLTGSTGSGAGQNDGFVASANDWSSGQVHGFITSDTASNAALIYFSSETTPTSPVANRFTFTNSIPRGAFAWIDRTSEYFSLSLTNAQTAAFAANKRNSTVPLYIVDIDSNGNPSEPVVYSIEISG